MQLLGFRKTPDLSLAPLQASCLRDLRAQIWRRAVVGSSRPFAHSGKSAVHKRPCLNDLPLIIERRSLPPAALRSRRRMDSLRHHHALGGCPPVSWLGKQLDEFSSPET